MGVGDRTLGVAYLSNRIRLSISACFEAITHSGTGMAAGSVKIPVLPSQSFGDSIKILRTEIMDCARLGADPPLLIHVFKLRVSILSHLHTIF